MSLSGKVLQVLHIQYIVAYKKIDKGSVAQICHSRVLARSHLNYTYTSKLEYIKCVDFNQKDIR